MNTANQDDTEFERFARQLAGEAGAGERAEFERLVSDPQVRARFEAVAADWTAADIGEGLDVDRAWTSLRSRLTSESTLGVGRKARGAQWWRTSGVLLRAAAAVIVVVGAGLAWNRLSGTADPAAPVSPIVASTKVAERHSVGLPDGTLVELAAASSLRTLPGFGEESREVELAGEARFKVTHDDKRPFRVRTGTAVIEDLGTEFVVRAITREPLRVSVSEGSVSVGRTGTPRGKHAVLQPRDVAILSDTGEVVVSRDVDVERYAAWTSGKLVFDHSPFRDAIVDLERWYDVEFDITDAVLLERDLNVEFNGEPIDGVLQVIGPALGVKLELQGRTVRVAAPARTGLIPPLEVQVGGGV